MKDIYVYLIHRINRVIGVNYLFLYQLKILKMFITTFTYTSNHINESMKQLLYLRFRQQFKKICILFDVFLPIFTIHKSHSNNKILEFHMEQLNPTSGFKLAYVEILGFFIVSKA